MGSVDGGRVHSWVSASVSLIVITASVFAFPPKTQGQGIGNDSTVAPEPASQLRSWQIGGFGMGGFPPYYAIHNNILHYQEQIHFYSAALEAGRMVTAEHGPGFLRGRGEAMVEVIPYWQMSHPAQTVTVYLAGSKTPDFLGGVQGFSDHGISVTPFLLRWNFMKDDTTRFVPWVQPGLGLLWTNKDFPQGYLTPGLQTSRWNFTPQVDFGEAIFVRKNRSINLGVRAVHITNFGLSTYDPGVNVVVEFSAGYSWWR